MVLTRLAEPLSQSVEVNRKALLRARLSTATQPRTQSGTRLARHGGH